MSSSINEYEQQAIEKNTPLPGKTASANMGLMKKVPSSAEKGGVWQRLHRQSKSQSSLHSTPEGCPEAWHCVVHLKLMRTFARIKRSAADDLIGRSVLESVCTRTDSHDASKTRHLLYKRAWEIYIEQAYLRFEIWWRSLAPKNSKGDILKSNRSTTDQSGYLKALLRDTKPFVWTEANIPPVDVIMILHSFMLNPRRFLEDCIRYNMISFWKAGIPWQLLDSVLDTSTGQYAVSPTAKKHWTKTTGCPWDVRESDLRMTYPCPACNSSIVIGLPDGIVQQTRQGHFSPLSLKSTLHCTSCDNTFENEHLQAHRFSTFIKDLQQHKISIPGTILGANGLPKPFDSSHTDLNTLLSDELGTQILAMTSPSQMRNSSKPTLTDLVIHITQSQPNPDLLRTLRSTISQTKDSHSIFSFSLPAAANRQLVFIDQMEVIDWLHTPSPTHTFRTLLHRYALFFQVMTETLSRVAVPTHAIDLAWHTHQLTPQSYHAYSLKHTSSNLLIDHDDRITDSTRTDGFEWTAAQFNALTPRGDEYTRCLCWYCATAEELTGPAKPLDTGAGGHVDVPVGSELDAQVCTRIAAMQFAKLQEDFEVVRRDAERTGANEPDRQKFLEGYVWLYPRAVPVIGK